MGASNEELLKTIRYYQDSLDKYSSIGNNYKLIGVIKKLKKLPIATSHLEETGIGRTVNALRKLGGEVGDAAKALVATWKDMVVQEDTKKGDTDNDKDEISKNNEKEISYGDTKHKRKDESSSHKSSDGVRTSEKERNTLDKYTSSSSLDRKDYRGKDSSKYKCEQDGGSEMVSSNIKGNSDSGSDSDRENYENKYSKSHSKRSGTESDEDEDNSSSNTESSGEDEEKETQKVNKSPEKKLSEGNKHERHSSKRKYRHSSSSESEDDYERKSPSKNHHRNGSEEEQDRNAYKQKSDVDKSSSSSHKSSHKSKDNERSNKKYKTDASTKTHSSKRKHHNSSDSEEEDREEKRVKSEPKHRSDSDDSDDKDKRHNSKKSSDYDDNTKKHKSKSSKSDKHEHESSDKSKSREKTDKTHDTSSKERSSSKKELDSAERKYKTKTGHESSEAQAEENKSKHEREHDKSHSSHSIKHEKKDRKDRDKEKSKDKHSHRKDESKPHEEKDKNSKVSKEKKTSSSSSSGKDSKSSSSKHKTSSDKSGKTKVETADTTRIKNGIGSESGASFAEALGMCGPMVFSKSTSSAKKKPSSLPSPEKQSKSVPVSAPVKPERTEPTEEKYVPNLLREQPPEPMHINVSSLLPEITPNYKPIAFPLDLQPKKILTPDEALSQAISNKNLRTKVYSGNKTRGGEVDSLFNICVKILQDNLDAMECTGGVPYIILKPIMEKATPDQLFNLEHYNPYLIEDTDELWRLHCMKEFRTKKREEMETWREMYMRCLDEREAKLNAITANIKESQDKSLPVRTTKLAYVDSIAKPPRNIARKQAKNGIINRIPCKTPSSKLSTLATSGEAGKVAVPNPGSRAVDRSSSSSSSSIMKPKKAPLMAKTLSLFKNRFKR